MQNNKMSNQSQDNSAPQAETTVDIKDYPELKDSATGDPVTGTFEGTVADISNGKVTIQYSKLELESGNPADKALEKMTGKKFGRPAPQANIGDEGDDY